MGAFGVVASLVWVVVLVSLGAGAVLDSVVWVLVAVLNSVLDFIGGGAFVIALF